MEHLRTSQGTSQISRTFGPSRGAFGSPASCEPPTPLAAQQAAAENARRLIVQLSAATDQVDESVRDDTEATLDVVRQVTEAIVGSSDEADADAAVAAVFESSSETAGSPADAWILDTCGVDIND